MLLRNNIYVLFLYDIYIYNYIHIIYIMIHCDVVFIIRAFETVYCVSVYVCAKENACIENLYEKYLLLSKLSK